MMEQRTTMSLTVPVIGIVRGVEGGFFKELMAASFVAGLEALEITMNTPGAEKIMARCRPEVPAGKLLGMGTIRNLAEAQKAYGAGAMFLVTPNFDPRVIEYGAALNLPVIAGGLTPSEIYGAYAAGAAMVKVFPCGALGGPGYIRELRGPFARIPLVPVGGVNKANLQDYFAAGATAVGVGASLFGRDALAAGDVEQAGKCVGDFLLALDRERRLLSTGY